MKVLIADRLPDEARTRLQGGGHVVVVEHGAAGEALTAALKTHRPDALVVRSTRVTAENLAAASSLELVIRAGAGVNTIDLAAASARGVFVANCPGMNAAAVAELTLAHILNADRRLADSAADLRAGHWRKKHYSQAAGIKGRTLGVLGCGAVGTAVIQRARAFEMAVVAWSPNLTAARCEALGVHGCASAIEVAQRADVLTVHLALTPTTRGFVGRAIFDALGRDKIFVNTSRGEVVDEGALREAIQRDGLRAGLDVFADEPDEDGDCHVALGEDPGVYGTHHVGAATQQAQDAVAAEACRIIETYAATGVPANCVNLAQESSATHLLVVRHADQVGVLAAVLDALRQAEINVQAMENVIFAGGEAACARIQIEGALTDEIIARVAADPRVFDARAVPLAAR